MCPGGNIHRGDTLQRSKQEIPARITWQSKSTPFCFLQTHTARFDAAAREHRILAQPDASRADAVANRGVALANRFRDDGDPLCFDVITSVVLQQGVIEIILSEGPLAATFGVAVGDLAPDLCRISIAFGRKRRGIEPRIVSGQTEASPDATLLRLLAKAHRWCREMRQGTSLTEIARREGHSESYIRTRAPLAFLSPKIQAAIVAGTQPADLSLERFVRNGIPLDWVEQEATYGFR